MPPRAFEVVAGGTVAPGDVIDVTIDGLASLQVTIGEKEPDFA